VLGGLLCASLDLNQFGICNTYYCPMAKSIRAIGAQIRAQPITIAGQLVD